MMEALLILVVVLIAVAYVAMPLMEGKSRTEVADGQLGGNDASVDEHIRSLEESLADLEYDVQAGKIAREDYDEQREGLLARIRHLHATRPGEHS